MEYRKLGNTDLEVSALGFGLWPIGGTTSHGYGTVDDQEAIRAIQEALDLGVTLFDTAPAYGNGRGEEILGDALAGRRDEAVIVTKAGVPWSEEEQTWLRDSSYAEITQSAETSLQRLQTDVIDVLLIHWPDPDTPFEEPMRAFADLKEAGKVRYVGVSNFSIEQMRECLKYGPLNAQQVGYNMFDRRMENEMLPFCLEHGIGVMTYGSLAHGLLTGTFSANKEFDAADWRSHGNIFGLPLFKRGNFEKNIQVVERLKELAESRGKTMVQLAIAWILRQPAVSVALTGARSRREIEENIGGTDWVLEDEDLAKIEEILEDAAGTTPEE